MALKTLVKISAVNNLSDARYCAGMAVDYMGFDLNPDSKSYVNYQDFVELTGWISGVALVGEFDINNKSEQIKEAVELYELDTIQISNPNQVQELKGSVKNIILKYNVDQIGQADEVAKQLEALKNNVSYFLFESENDIQYKPHIQNEVLKLAEAYPVIMGFNLHVDSIGDLLATSRLNGISLKGGEEIRPGYKDFDELADILEALEDED